MNTNSTLQARISPQWLSELRRLWPSVPWWVSCELVSLIGTHTMPAQQHSQSTLTSLGQGCMCVRCDLPPALLTEWQGSFMCHCGNTRVEQTPNKSPHTKLTQKRKILPSLLPGFELTTFQSQVWSSTNKLSQLPSSNTKHISIMFTSDLTHTRYTILPSSSSEEGPALAVLGVFMKRGKMVRRPRMSTNFWLLSTPSMPVIEWFSTLMAQFRDSFFSLGARQADTGHDSFDTYDCLVCSSSYFFFFFLHKRHSLFTIRLLFITFCILNTMN